nr:ribonuclease H-like domain-containing protein [Tanacetum cinerariifolium]
MEAASKVYMLKPGVITQPITTTEEKAQTRLEVKARSTLMMGIPNEHQLLFNSIKDAKQLLEAVEKRFGMNAATKKTQRNLLKQQYENFTASNSEMLEQTFDMLQKLNTYAVVWRNKVCLDTISMDDLYNNHKVYEPEVKRMSSSSSSTQNMAFVQPNSPQLVHKDLQQIHSDDMEEMDLRCQMAMLTMRARRCLKNTRRKLTVNSNETVGLDKSKVKCYNCHNRRHFARKCKAPRQQEQGNLKKEARERKAKSTLLMAIPDEYLARFHGIKDAKPLWTAIKTRFGGNDESRKMKKVLKKQFEIFFVSNSEGLDKGYDRFQRLLSLLEIYGGDNLDIDDLYNNLKVYEADIKGSFGSSSNSQNVAFFSAESTSSTNELNATYSVSTATCHNNEDLEQIDQDDLEEMDLKWQGDRLGTYDWRFQVEEEATDFALKAFTSNPSSSSSLNSEREKLRKANLEIVGYQYGLESIEGQLRVHQQNEVIYEENIRVLEYDIKDKSYDSQFNEKEVLDVKEEEVTETVFDNRSSDKENSLANDRFKKGEGYHEVPPPLTGNYMPPKFDLSFAGLDDSI